MRNCFILFALLVITTGAAAQSADTLPPKGWTTDYEHIFTTAQINTLDSIIGAYRKATGIEIAIVTIDSAKTTKADFDDFVKQLGNDWGIGKQEGNGIVIGISAFYRRIRIQTGKGIVERLPNTQVKLIITENITPFYKKNEYYTGTKNGLLAIIEALQ
jgi:uncharacterized protein